MKKTWVNAEVEELTIEATASGFAPKEEFDGDWTQIDGKWYRPGNGSASTN